MITYIQTFNRTFSEHDSLNEVYEKFKNLKETHSFTGTISLIPHEKHIKWGITPKTQKNDK